MGGTPGDFSKNSTHALTTHPHSSRVFPLQNCHLTSFVFHKKKFFLSKDGKNRLILSKSSSSNNGSERMEASFLSFPPFFLYSQEISQSFFLFFRTTSSNFPKIGEIRKRGRRPPLAFETITKLLCSTPPAFLSLLRKEKKARKTLKNFESAKRNGKE